jgi:hypothetical protein
VTTSHVGELQTHNTKHRNVPLEPIASQWIVAAAHLPGRTLHLALALQVLRSRLRLPSLVRCLEFEMLPVNFVAKPRDRLAAILVTALPAFGGKFGGRECSVIGRNGKPSY